MEILARHHVTVTGPDGAQPIVFVHGFGCDQTMWRRVAPAFADRYRVITFDHVGAGGTEPVEYDEQKYSTLKGYAADVIAIVEELDLHDVVLVGHSVSAMIGALAVIEEPDRFDKLVLVAPSPRYIDDESYTGGFSREDVEELLDSLASNYLGWSSAMAPVIVGNSDRPQLGSELTASFCRMDPEIARQFARATFFSDDVLAPDSVGEYVAKAVPDATLVRMAATGHCPNLSAPEETIAAIDHFLRHLQAA
jgi:sigma-B regulation protein RsbQ